MALYSEFDETCLICGSIESTSQISDTSQVRVTEEFCELYEIDNQLDEVWNAIQFGFYCPKCLDDMEFISEFNYRHQIETGKEDSDDLKKLRKLQLDHKIKLRKCIDNLMASQDVDEDDDELLFWEEIVKRQQLLMCMELRHGVADATEPVIVTIKPPSPVPVRRSPTPTPTPKTDSESESESEPEQVDLVSDSDSDIDSDPVPVPVPDPVPTTSDPPNLDSNRNEIKQDDGENDDEIPESESEFDDDSDSDSDVDPQSVTDIEEDIDMDIPADADTDADAVVETLPEIVIPNPNPNPTKLNTSPGPVGSHSGSNHSSKLKSAPATKQVCPESPEAQIPLTKNTCAKSKTATPTRTTATTTAESPLPTSSSSKPSSSGKKFEPKSKPKPKPKQTPEIIKHDEDDHPTRLRSQRKPVPAPKTSKDVSETETETVVELKRERKSKSKDDATSKRIKIMETSTSEDNDDKAKAQNNTDPPKPKPNRQLQLEAPQRGMKTRKTSIEREAAQMTGVYSSIRQSIRSKSASLSPPEPSAKIPTEKNLKKLNVPKTSASDLDLNLEKASTSNRFGPKRNSRLNSSNKSKAQSQCQSQPTEAEAEPENKILTQYKRQYNLKELTIVLHRIQTESVTDTKDHIPPHGKKGERTTRSGRVVKKTFKAQTFEKSANKIKGEDAAGEERHDDEAIVIEGPASPVKKTPPTATATPTASAKSKENPAGRGLKQKYGGRGGPGQHRRAKYPCATATCRLKYKCPSCAKNYASRAALTKHKRNIHGPKNSNGASAPALKFKCASCPKSYPRRKHLTRHEKSHDEAYVQENLTCVDCNHVFFSKPNLEIHEQADHPDKCLFQCETRDCNFRARTPKRLEQHEQLAHVGLRTETEPPQPTKGAFECQVENCAYSARSETQLRLHREHVHGKAIRLFECQSCPKRFDTFTNLKKHTNKVHRQDQFYVCRTCGKAFSQRSYLTAHEATHNKGSGEGRSVCGACGAGFGTKSGLIKHERKQHSQTGEEVSEVGPNNSSPSKTTTTTYPCKYCNKSCPSVRTLALHKRQKHPENYQYQCAHCSFGAPSLPPLEEHIYAVHSFDRPFECPLCGNTFKTETHLKKHTRTAHPAEHKKLSSSVGPTLNSGEEPNPDPNALLSQGEYENGREKDDALVHASEEILGNNVGEETNLEINSMDPMPVQMEMETEAELIESHLLGSSETESEMSGRRTESETGTETEPCVEGRPDTPSLIPQHQMPIPCHEFDLAFGFQLVDM